MITISSKTFFLGTFFENCFLWIFPSPSYLYETDSTIRLETDSSDFHRVFSLSARKRKSTNYLVPGYSFLHSDEALSWSRRALVHTLKIMTDGSATLLRTRQRLKLSSGIQPLCICYCNWCRYGDRCTSAALIYISVQHCSSQLP